ncbi:TonB-dependent receptor [Parerythrobacter aurantius]|uniref:TonB-dependent receptor n=1 Tax=Parerythrobacter aurantius TaxID=3127706 RepID=UPI003251B5AF
MANEIEMTPVTSSGSASVRSVPGLRWARSVLLVSVASIGFGATPVLAQSAPEQADDPATEPVAGEGEGIIVTGIRGSLEKAAQIKRDSSQIVDVITAEDVGKLPDANVAEALQRVTGVQITRVFGEGQAVNIRGLQQVRVEVDGRTLLGFSARVSPPENDNLGRSSGLDAVPSSVFGRLEVRKSPLASQAEGGLGGTVNLFTPKPFDFRKTTLSVRAQGTYSDGADKFEPAFTGLFTTKFADGNIGILLAGEYQKRTSSLQLFERNNWLNRRNGGTTDVLAPLLLQYENVDIDRSRYGVNGALQFSIGDNFVLTADALYSKVEADRTNQAITFNLPTSNTATIVTNAVNEGGYLVAGTATGRVRVQNQRRQDPTDNFLAGLNGKFDDGTLSLEADAYYSRGTLRQQIEVVVLDSVTNVVGRYDFRDGPIPSLTLERPAGTPFDPNLVSNFIFPTSGTLTLRANLLPATLEEWTGKFDVGYDGGSGVVVRAGVRYVDLSAESDSFRSRGLATAAELAPFAVPGNPDFLDRIPGSFPRSFLSYFPDPDFLIPRVTATEPPLATQEASPNGYRRNVDRDYDLSEKTLSGYFMFDAEGELFGIPAKVNAGVRVSHTKFRVDTFSLLRGVSVLTTDRNSYTNVLPSANVTFNVTDDFLARISASQTMQRAGLADLAPSTFVNQTNLTSGGGNAQLTPPISTNFDVSFEYYTGRSSLFSAALFYKDVEDFIATGTIEEIIPGFESDGPYRTSRPFNIASAKVRGFEVGMQQFLDFLPSPFDGLGVIANYTYADSEDSNGFPLVATSKHSYNLVALYEKGPVSARVAYNWRDDAVFEFTQGRPEVIAARSQLDAQLGIDLTDRIALSFQAQNLIPEDSATVEISNFNPTALNSYALSERRLSVGVRAKF